MYAGVTDESFNVYRPVLAGVSLPAPSQACDRRTDRSPACEHLAVRDEWKDSVSRACERVIVGGGPATLPARGCFEVVIAGGEPPATDLFSRPLPRHDRTAIA